ncbi:MAG: tetratricopeptide repeat protein [Spirochaetaceae bacterium]|nr:tetratricopeptide repeat protein [Spirochaetaceae bacterium]
MRKITLPALLILLLYACATEPRTLNDISSDLPVERYFRLAQEAADRGRFNLAILYYQKIYELFPTDVRRITAAEYGEALIHFRLGRFDEAEALFRAIIARFNNPVFGPRFGPNDRWILVLSQARLADIEARR